MFIKWIVIIPLTFAIVLGITMAVLSMTGVVGHDQCEKYNWSRADGEVIYTYSQSQHKAVFCLNVR